MAAIKKKIISTMMIVFFRVLHFWVKTDARTVFFQAFDGRGYLDNPKALFEAMRSDERFTDFRFVWAMSQPTQISGAHVVKKNSLAYYIYLSKAKYWIFNHKTPDYLVKKSDQCYLQTWHGTPLKRLAHDIPDTGKTYYRSRLSYTEMVIAYDKDSKQWDYLISPNRFATTVFQSAFHIPRAKLIETGYPRNDDLTRPDVATIARIKAEYHIPSHQKVVLYAPTWRDNAFNVSGYTCDLKLDIAKWQTVLGSDYVVLFKPHYLINKHFKVPEGMADFMITVPASADINVLYLMSDVLVTDYSSVFFDYANLNRPIYFYMFDRDIYEQELRGFYLTVPDDLPGEVFEREDDLLAAISNGSYDFDRLATFNKRFNDLADGQASEKVIKEVFG